MAKGATHDSPYGKRKTENEGDRDNSSWQQQHQGILENWFQEQLEECSQVKLD